MQDCLDRELSIGDEVAFTVGCNMVTGTIIRFRTNKYEQEVARVELTEPEPRPDSQILVRNEDGTVRRDLQGYPMYVRTPKDPLRFRDVIGDWRIVLLKGINQ